ncbi:cation:proton antiporter [Actinomadura sp. 6K520]|uniref:cation:proton antiporter domain-containing protein n=1 Tax=Actinomadura sp. 6K520 TaxID=2530364 RepID=UPI00104BE9D6|nr:cation:proton antiporter [Actinomadura sp. 6K520]TDE32600.1 cation/H(+) antiporter [Actinomadura sp. 6K520]
MTSHQVQLLFADLALILVLARGLGALATRVGQPAVVGEIVAGILLGPTLLSDGISEALFPAEVQSVLAGIADLGLAVFMFAVGLEVDTGALRGRGRPAVGAIVGATLVPFGLGLGLGFHLLRAHPVEGSPAAAFVVFIGLAVSVTAFPVLARILEDRGLFATPLGGLALAVAAIVDVAAWVALAAVQAMVGGEAALWRAGLFVCYAALLFLVVRPLLRGFLSAGGAGGPLTPWTFAVLLSGTLLSAVATQAMGMHLIMGAFLFGLIMPRGGGGPALRAELEDRLGQLTAVLLPVYFVVAGLRIDLASLDVSDLWLLCLIMAVAVAGKVGGTYLGLRTQGMPARPSAAIAALMNTRGLTGPVVLGVGLQFGLLDDPLYSLMVVMTLLTTLMTGPLLSLTLRGHADEPAAAGGAREPTGRTAVPP